MKPIVLETKDGRASITKEDLIQIIQDSYDEGFKDGQREFFVPTYNIKCSDEELKELIENAEKSSITDNGWHKGY